jgi:hypothetical protein
MNRFSIVMVALGMTMACGGASASPEAKSPKTTSTSAAAPAPLAVTGTGATATPPAEMGIEAKRSMKHFQDEILPKEMAKFKTSCGIEIPVDVDWESFGNDAERIKGLSSNRGLAELNEAFSKICKDQIGKDGVKAKIQRLAFKNTADKANKKMALENGAFKIDGAYDPKALTDGTFPSSAYRSYLEKQL